MLLVSHPCHQQAASPELYTTSCKHTLVLLRMGEIIGDAAGVSSLSPAGSIAGALYHKL